MNLAALSQHGVPRSVSPGLNHSYFSDRASLQPQPALGPSPFHPGSSPGEPKEALREVGLGLPPAVPHPGHPALHCRMVKSIQHISFFIKGVQLFKASI